MKFLSTLLLLLLIGFVSFAQTGIFEDKMILYLPFDDNINDESPKSVQINNGAGGGDITFDTGKFGKAGVFDGSTTNYVTDGLQFNSYNSFTIMGWIKMNRVGSGGQRWLSQKDGPNTGRIHMEVRNDGTLGAAIQNSGGAGSVLSTGVWYHFAIRLDRDAGEVSMFINGTEEKVTVAGTETCTGEVVIGSFKTEGGGFADGLLDEVLYYDGALNDESIQAVMNNGVQGAIIPVADVVPVGIWVVLASFAGIFGFSLSRFRKKKRV